MHTEHADDRTGIKEKGKIPQAKHTYRYLNTAYPCLNEHQLGIGDRQALDQYIGELHTFLEKYQLAVNPDKVRIYQPDEAFDFLGFKCKGHDIDIADATRQKMKDKIRRKARALQRWRSQNDVDGEKAMKALIRHFNRKFFESDDPAALTWARWFFPIINQTEGLKEIDHYLQENLRYVATGRHNKANYRIRYDLLKKLGYRSLVHAFYDQ